MLKLKFLFFLLCTTKAFSSENPSGIIYNTHDRVEDINSAVATTNTACKLASLLIYSDELQLSKIKSINQQIKAIRFEEELIGCVAKNAYDSREENQLPVNCNKTAALLSGLAGFE